MLRVSGLEARGSSVEDVKKLHLSEVPRTVPWGAEGGKDAFVSRVTAQDAACEQVKCRSVGYTAGKRSAGRNLDSSLATISSPSGLSSSTSFFPVGNLGSWGGGGGEKVELSFPSVLPASLSLLSPQSVLFLPYS